MARILMKSALGAAALMALGGIASAQSVAITHAKLVIGDGSAPIEDGTVVIRDGRVVAAGAARSGDALGGAECSARRRRRDCFWNSVARSSPSFCR